MLRYWPWSGEMVISGRPLARELVIAASRSGSGRSRLEWATASIGAAKLSGGGREDMSK